MFASKGPQSHRQRIQEDAVAGRQTRGIKTFLSRVGGRSPAAVSSSVGMTAPIDVLHRISGTTLSEFANATDDPG